MSSLNNSNKTKYLVLDHYIKIIFQAIIFNIKVVKILIMGKN